MFPKGRYHHQFRPISVSGSKSGERTEIRPSGKKVDERIGREIIENSVHNEVLQFGKHFGDSTQENMRDSRTKVETQVLRLQMGGKETPRQIVLLESGFEVDEHIRGKFREHGAPHWEQIESGAPNDCHLINLSQVDTCPWARALL
ncbi:hypothetical protein TYRP_002073 [Tyrophagus putrescentiae]|nr:hypothetical protein TYRP_002073 [Tyrophagus putrescentiae]